jgi:hypothetical protein
MAQFIIRLLQIACLIFFAMLLIDVFVGTMRTGPPLVPLDTQGHMAPYSESPFFGI